MTTLKVGQELWYVPRDLRLDSPRAVTIESIGRKWAICGRARRGGRILRIDIKTMAADGGKYSSPGRCHLSQKAYEEDAAIREAWRRLSECMERRRWKPSEKATVELIAQARELLGIPEAAE